MMHIERVGRKKRKIGNCKNGRGGSDAGVEGEWHWRSLRPNSSMDFPRDQGFHCQMREKGYRRSAEQCKCKWKNLVNRYKGIETQDPENGRQCPFFVTEKMQRLLQLEAEGGSGRAKKKAKVLKSSDECSDEEEDDESEEEKVLKKRKSDRERLRVTAEKSRANSMHDVLEDFFKQQQNIEMQWRESVESREQDRRFREQEWREAMENLERERIFMERAWREREEQRRAREEARSEKRDALLTTLINRLIREDL